MFGSILVINWMRLGAASSWRSKERLRRGGKGLRVLIGPRGLTASTVCVEPWLTDWLSQKQLQQLRPGSLNQVTRASDVDTAAPAADWQDIGCGHRVAEGHLLWGGTAFWSRGVDRKRLKQNKAPAEVKELREGRWWTNDCTVSYIRWEKNVFFKEMDCSQITDNGTWNRR